MHWILFCRDLLTNSASNWTSLDASRSRVDYLLKIIVSLLNSNGLFLYLQFFFLFSLSVSKNPNLGVGE